MGPIVYGAWIEWRCGTYIETTNEHGEPTLASYRWTAWVWEITNSNQDFKEITCPLRWIHKIFLNLRKTKRSQHVIGWPWKHSDRVQNDLQLPYDSGEVFKTKSSVTVWFPSEKSSLLDKENYTKYDIQCHIALSVTMVTFWMTLLINKWTNSIMNDRWVHPLSKNHYTHKDQTTHIFTTYVHKSPRTVETYSPLKKCYPICICVWWMTCNHTLWHILPL